MKSGCTVPNCTNLVHGNGLCSGHRTRLRVNGDVLAHIPLKTPTKQITQTCLVPECGGKAVSKNLCTGHYSRLRLYGDPLVGGPLKKVSALTFTECQVEGCGNPGRLVRGFCASHYRSFMRWGDPLRGTRSKQERDEGRKRRLEWLEAHLETQHNPAVCVEWPWPFPGADSKTNYGKVTVGGVTYGVHNYVLRQIVGPPPSESKAWALHSCDNSLCINPHHLRWGDHADNMRDMSLRKRAVIGERAVGSKLTETDVQSIRQQHDAGERVRDIWACYPFVCRQTIDSVCKRKSWKHLT